MAGKHLTKSIDLTGRKIGLLTVLERMDDNHRGQMQWRCKCDCGTPEKIIYDKHLRNAATKSCGCLHRVMLIKRNATHGKAKVPEYKPWAGMKDRCLNPKNPRFHNYGGRGITLCPEWADINTFIADMGPRPSLGHSIERRDNQKGYSPDNCYWATREQQQNNRRKNKYITFQGLTMTIAQWARHLSIDYSTLQARIKRGWDIEKALTSNVLVKPSFVKEGCHD